uniref:CSON007635 protein n=1 Tax=Culicoides sonorensis TaxID=179676 RepID=A0A336N6J3_CULSO
MNKKTTLLLFSILFHTVLSSGLDEPKRRIFGGYSAHPSQFLYHASLRVFGKHFCSGAILSRKWIVTVANCFNEVKEDTISITVAYGTINNTGHEPTHTIDKIIIHEMYKNNEAGHNFDIALIKLKCPISFNEFVQPIKINIGSIETGDDATMSGWGDTEFGDNPTHLKYLNVQLISNERCKSQFRKLKENIICSKVPAGKGACTGDSGSPIVKENKLVGLISFNVITNEVKCASGNPSGSIQVSKFIDWIKDKMKCPNMKRSWFN